MIEKWFEPFSFLEKIAHRDGAGGESVTFSPSFSFQGVLTLTTGSEICAGGQPMLQETPALLHEFDVTLSHGDCIRREKDGATYRVAGRSENMRTPAFSGLRFAQVPVERVVIPC